MKQLLHPVAQRKVEIVDAKGTRSLPALYGGIQSTCTLQHDRFPDGTVMTCVARASGLLLGHVPLFGNFEPQVRSFWSTWARNACHLITVARTKGSTWAICLAQAKIRSQKPLGQRSLA